MNSPQSFRAFLAALTTVCSTLDSWQPCREEKSTLPLSMLCTTAGVKQQQSSVLRKYPAVFVLLSIRGMLARFSVLCASRLPPLCRLLQPQDAASRSPFYYLYPQSSPRKLGLRHQAGRRLHIPCRSGYHTWGGNLGSFDQANYGPDARPIGGFLRLKVNLTWNRFGYRRHSWLHHLKANHGPVSRIRRVLIGRGWEKTGSFLLSVWRNSKSSQVPNRRNLCEESTNAGTGAILSS